MYGEDLDIGQPAMDHYQLRVPHGTPVDGAVAELSRDERGIITADIRIPGSKAALDAYQEASNEIHYLTGD